MTRRRKVRRPAGPVGWARVWPAAKRSASRILRQGAWYAVLEEVDEVKVVLDIGGRPVKVPRRILQIRQGPARPEVFAVVTRSQEALEEEGNSGAVELGRHYAVCPICSTRQPVWGNDSTARCPQCGTLGEVAWWDTG